MSNISQRLRRLEPGPHHQEYLEEVSWRLLRYAVETRHQVKAGKLTALAWSEDEEVLYQEWANDPGFEAREREILANPRYSGEIEYAR